MIYKILEFNSYDHSKQELLNFQNEIIESKNARYIFLFSKYVKNINIGLLSKEILKTNDKRYIHFFIRTIKNIDYDIFIDKVIEFKDSQLLFYVMHDNLNLSRNNVDRIIKNIYILNDQKYLGIALYYYFCIFDYKNEKIFCILKEYLKLNNIDTNDINIDNCKKILDESKSKLFRNQNIKENIEEFTKNCYVGRNGFIPDIIVCHITSSYKKAINDFYDETTSVSSHYIISENGEIRNVVALQDSAWANGTSINQESDVYYKFATNKIVNDRDYNANYYTFSIEHESLDGNLNLKQYESTLKVINEIILFVKKEYNYDFIIDREHIIGHKEVNPIVRTICPGDKFPFDKIINDVIDRNKI